MVREKALEQKMRMEDLTYTSHPRLETKWVSVICLRNSCNYRLLPWHCSALLKFLKVAYQIFSALPSMPSPVLLICKGRSGWSPLLALTPLSIITHLLLDPAMNQLSTLRKPKWALVPPLWATHLWHQPCSVDVFWLGTKKIHRTGPKLFASEFCQSLKILWPKQILFTRNTVNSGTSGLLWSSSF